LDKIIISVIGQDRPGILAAVSRVLLANDCNLENVSQTLLQSVFAALFIVSKPEQLAVDNLRTALTEGVTDFNLDIHTKTYVGDQSAGAGHKSQPFIITTVGADKKGLVAAITRVLADYAVNVSGLQAVFRGGETPMDNTMIFQVDVPDQISLPSLVRDLEYTAGKLDLDINIQHRKIFESMTRI